MKISAIDLIIILLYIGVMVVLGITMRNRARKSKDHYLMAGKSLPWYMLGLSDASDMFDISGTMLLVSMAFVYGIKSVWIPWMWPVFNQIFLMVFLSRWLRRSNASTGADWMKTRFGATGKGVVASHIIVIVFALILCSGYMAYAFVGLGKFIEIFLPYQVVQDYLPFVTEGNLPQFYGITLTIIATFYSVIGGMHGIVLADVIKYGLLTVASVSVGIIAMNHLAKSGTVLKTPSGWDSPFFGKELGLDWSNFIADAAEKIKRDGYQMFSAIFGMMIIKGVLVSMAGPAPNYDCQKILSTRSPQEASKMSGFISIILMPIRYFLTMGLCVLGLLYFTHLNVPKNDGITDFEQVLPAVINNYLPAGLIGLMLAGFLGAFMSNFSGTLNAAQAYIVNDIYLRYINPGAEKKKVLLISYSSGILMMFVGITLGLLIHYVNDIFTIITAGLYGGFVCANVLKWYWWRFNAHGYFWGMAAGIVASIIFTNLFPGLKLLFAFPLLFIIELIACIIGTYTAPATDEAVLKQFYKTVRPWGFWKPVLAKVKADDPSFNPNKNLGINILNVVLGTFGQVLLMLFPMYLVLMNWKAFGIVSALIIVVLLIMYNTWYKKLDED